MVARGSLDIIEGPHRSFIARRVCDTTLRSSRNATERHVTLTAVTPAGDNGHMGQAQRRRYHAH